MEREDKMKMTCSPEQLAEILRSMADAMERGRLSLDTVEVGWNEVEKISLAIRNAVGMADVKIRISSSDRVVELPEDAEEVEGVDESAGSVLLREQSPDVKETDPASPGKPAKPRGSYGSLKKRMKKSFKNIMYALHENSWPTMVDIEDFIRDSEQMVLYPDKGDEFYPAYNEAVAAFADAVRLQDLDAAYQAAHLLNTLKTQCHKKYD